MYILHAFFSFSILILITVSFEILYFLFEVRKCNEFLLVKVIHSYEGSTDRVQLNPLGSVIDGSLHLISDHLLALIALISDQSMVDQLQIY